MDKRISLWNSKSTRILLSLRRLTTYLSLLSFLYGCGAPKVIPRLAPADREGIKSVVVRESQPELKIEVEETLPKSTSSGFLTGGSIGCLGGLHPATWFVGGPFTMSPLMAGAMAACGHEVAKVDDPIQQLLAITAQVETQDFPNHVERNLQTIITSRQKLKEKISSKPTTTSNDLILEIQKINLRLYFDYGTATGDFLGCHPAFSINVHWRVVNEKDGLLREERISSCAAPEQKESFSKWFENPDQRRSEVTELLERLERLVAKDLFSGYGNRCDSDQETNSSIEQ